MIVCSDDIGSTDIAGSHRSRKRVAIVDSLVNWNSFRVTCQRVFPLAVAFLFVSQVLLVVVVVGVVAAFFVVDVVFFTTLLRVAVFPSVAIPTSNADNTFEVNNLIIQQQNSE